MLEGLCESGYLSPDQADAAGADGNFFLLACPGSGKTRSAGVRFARLSTAGVRVAATSYTNVGVEQIRGVVGRDLGHAAPSRCFIGTLHSLLLRYVFYPFAHLVMGCNQRVRLMVDDGPWDDVVFGGNNAIRLPLSSFAFHPDGSLCVRRTKQKFPYSRERAAEMEQAQALQMKMRFASYGLASFEDSMYWSLRVLEENERLAKAVAERFEEIIIDEAQDTSELQLAAVNRIWQTGDLNSLVVIGDIEQSIYAFQGASPSGCEGLIKSARLRTVPLTKNYRSSQLICNLAANFCSRKEPDEAVGEHAECDIEPELHLYDPDNPVDLTTVFKERITAHKLDSVDCVILARGGELVDELNDESEVVEVAKNPLALGRAAAALRGSATVTRYRIEAIDRMVSLAAWGTDLDELDSVRRRELRFATMRLLAKVSELGGDLRSWVKGAASSLDQVLLEITDQPKKRGSQVIRSKKAQSGYQAADFFTPPKPVLRAQTVHRVKGASHDGVFIVVDRYRSARHGEQGALWSEAVGGEIAPEFAEEIRIAFVAMTRARRYCALALPLGTNEDVVQTFTKAGFRPPPEYQSGASG
jgi:DNA helicase II / ATP-dependent DNA helicase PcrA